MKVCGQTVIDAIKEAKLEECEVEFGELVFLKERDSVSEEIRFNFKNKPRSYPVRVKYSSYYE